MPPVKLLLSCHCTTDNERKEDDNYYNATTRRSGRDRTTITVIVPFVADDDLHYIAFVSIILHIVQILFLIPILVTEVMAGGFDNDDNTGTDDDRNSRIEHTYWILALCVATAEIMVDGFMYVNQQIKVFSNEVLYVSVELVRIRAIIKGWTGIDEEKSRGCLVSHLNVYIHV
jgi:hypothetical protein